MFISISGRDTDDNIIISCDRRHYLSPPPEWLTLREGSVAHGTPGQSLFCVFVRNCLLSHCVGRLSARCLQCSAPLSLGPSRLRALRRRRKLRIQAARQLSISDCVLAYSRLAHQGGALAFLSNLAAAMAQILEKVAHQSGHMVLVKGLGNKASGSMCPRARWPGPRARRPRQTTISKVVDVPFF